MRGEAWPVHRIDCEDGYFLVVFGSPDAAVAVAAVDRTSGELLSWARLGGASSHLGITAQEAARKAGMPAGESTARLVWRPCRQSRSPLYPLWEVREGSRIVYVDQQGATWPRLDPDGAGGGDVA